ncbi:hypothetical protein EDB84DRAFT_1562207 [Lactarius hengduanensis]|nr:hypothetical protein EDB84DRAFT_1562207 [Lactarius hengduanensis]
MSYRDLSTSYKRSQPARPAATCAAAAAQEQRKRSRSGVPQAASSADTTASAPQLRGSPYVTYGRRITARIDSSAFRFRGNVCEQQRQRHLRADVRGAFTTRQQYKTLAATFTTRAATGSPYACRDISNRATFAQAPAPLPRRHARQQRRENNQEQPHQVASSADATASAPQLRGGSHVAIEFQRTLRIDRSVYRSRSSVHDRTRSGSSKTDSQRSKELKRKTAAATTVALRTRRRARCVRRLAMIVSTRDSIYDTRGDVRGTRRSASGKSSVHQTLGDNMHYSWQRLEKHAAMCATPADRQQRNFLCKSRSIASPTAATAPALRESSRLTQGSKTVLQVGEEHPLATYLKRKRTSNSAAIAHPLATCLDDKDDTAYHLTHFRLLRLHAPQTSTARHTLRPRAPRPSAAHHNCDCAHRDLVRAPHSRAALATPARRVPDVSGHLYQVSRRAKACATVSDHLRPANSISPSRPRRTCARHYSFDSDAPATAADIYTTPRAPRRPARPLATLHTPKTLHAS